MSLFCNPIDWIALRVSMNEELKEYDKEFGGP